MANCSQVLCDQRKAIYARSSLRTEVALYKNLRIDLYTENIKQNKKAEDAVMQYLAKIKDSSLE